MKKFFWVGLLLLVTACQSTATTPAPEATPTTAVQTPTLPVTATETLVPTPTWTATPIPLYFTEEFDSSLGAWISFLTSGDTSPHVGLNNSLLDISFQSPNTFYYAILNANNYETVHVDAKFEWHGAQPNSVGVLCQYDEKNGWFEYNFASDGTYSLLFGQWLADGIAHYRPIVNDSSEYLTPGHTDYEIGITCESDALWLYINGKLFRKIDVSTYELTKGKVGVTAADFENAPLDVYFDWFKVSESGE